MSSATRGMTGAERCAMQVIAAIDGDLHAQDTVRACAADWDWPAIRPVVLRHRPESGLAIDELRGGSPQAPRRAARTTCMADVAPVDVAWLWRDRIHPDRRRCAT